MRPDIEFRLVDPRYCGDVAQLGEHLLCKQGVRGSNPLISTRIFAGSKNSEHSRFDSRKSENLENRECGRISSIEFRELAVSLNKVYAAETSGFAL